jgi:uncharacterized membrane protein (GlpM family)
MASIEIDSETIRDFELKKPAFSCEGRAMPIWLKYAVTAGLVVIISEFAKRSDRLGAFIGALPWTTTLVMIWLFVEKQGSQKIGNHAWYTFWYVLPTMPMFLLLPWLLQKNWSFPAAMGASVLLTVICFGVLGLTVRRFGIELW